MSWVTFVWSAIAAACVTLAAIYSLVWFKNRTAWAHLLFAMTAGSTAGIAFCELWMMRAETPAEFFAARTWLHLPLFVWLVSTTWFVWTYLGAGRRWLAWTIFGLRAVSALANLLIGPSLYREASTLSQLQFLGESVTVSGRAPNLLTPFTQFGTLLVIIFVADASITAWRRGDRGKALRVGGSVEFFLIASLSLAVAVVWGNVGVPVVFSLFYMGLVAVMGYELSRDVLRASHLVRGLQASEAQLRENQATLKASNRQISDLFGRLLTAQETERTRIARDLHDDVSQQIAAVSMSISGLKRKIGGQPDQADVILELTAMQQRTIALADGIRQISHSLHPSTLQHAGLVTTLSVFCNEFERLHGIAVTFRAGTDIGDIEADIAVCIYRVTQEVLRNVAKHADARQVGVALTRTADGVELVIVDDGKGFDLAKTRGRPAGIGLVSVDERVRLLGGTVQVDTQLGEGTRVQVQIPCQRAVAAM